MVQPTLFNLALVLRLKQIQSEVGAALTARQAAGRIFRLEDEELSIDPLSEDGAKGPSRGSAVTFRGVKFAYPQRPDAPVGRLICLCSCFICLRDHRHCPAVERTSACPPVLF